MSNYRFKPNDNEAERVAEQAYRRGVHQALAMLQYYIKEEGVPADIALADAVEIANDIRSSDKAHGWLTHELVNKVYDRHKKRLAKAAKVTKVIP